MKLIVGLGNPGNEYVNTRHNSGYMALDELARLLEVDEFLPNEKFQCLITNTVLNEEKITLVKPTTFMNNSGITVRSLVQFLKIAPEDLWVVYDDIDLPIGQNRIKKNGGPGTHNGMKSIIKMNNINNFPRFRIGIESRGESAPDQQDISSFVLSRFSADEVQIIKKSLMNAAESIKFALENNVDDAMNKYNTNKA